MIHTDNTSTSSSAFFERKYQKKDDPWNFATDDYELCRYRAIVSALSHRRYRFALEPGCSIGVLTEQLSHLCAKVEAFDFSPTAAAKADARCSRLKNVSVRFASITEPTQTSGFDLIVLSEIGYYFDQNDWQSISWRLIDAMPQGGTVLAAHWLGHSKDHRISGDLVHHIVLSNPQLQIEHSERNAGFRLDRLVRQ